MRLWFTWLMIKKDNNKIRYYMNHVMNHNSHVWFIITYHSHLNTFGTFGLGLNLTFDIWPCEIWHPACHSLHGSKGILGASLAPQSGSFYAAGLSQCQRPDSITGEIFPQIPKRTYKIKRVLLLSILWADASLVTHRLIKSPNLIRIISYPFAAGTQWDC